MQSSQNLIIRDILTEAIKRRASDLHFSVGNAPVIKVDDKLVSMEDREIITQEFMESFVQSALSEEDQQKLNTEKELIITHDFDRNLRFKINLFFQKNYYSATLRYIPERVPSIDALKLETKLKEFAKLKRGLIIISGPFGSGKSATAAAIIEEINQTEKEYIITVEKPLEYIFTNNQSIIEQREVGRDTASYEKALQYFQEEGADVLFLQELKDAKIIPLVLEIARSSSLVLTTVVADSTSQTIYSILDSFPSFDQERIKNLLATSLKAIICQKLVPKIGGGMIAVQEVMIVNEAIRSILTSGNVSHLDNTVQTSRQEGMITFDQVLADLVRKGIVSNEDAVANAVESKNFDSNYF